MNRIVPTFGEIDKNAKGPLLSQIREKSGKKAGYFAKKSKYHNKIQCKNRFFAENCVDLFLFAEMCSIIEATNMER